LGEVKLGDFGQSEKLANSEDQVKQDRGTPQFLPPECFKKHEYGVSPLKIDIWAVGCIIYETLFGRHPFRSTTRNDLIKIVCEKYSNNVI